MRSRGYAPDSAEDLAQEFFARLIESRGWRRADQAQGKFRSFLPGALVHVVDHVREREQAQKRGGGPEVERRTLLIAGSHLE